MEIYKPFFINAANTTKLRTLNCDCSMHDHPTPQTGQPIKEHSCIYRRYETEMYKCNNCNISKKIN